MQFVPQLYTTALYMYYIIHNIAIKDYFHFYNQNHHLYHIRKKTILLYRNHTQIVVHDKPYHNSLIVICIVQYSYMYTSLNLVLTTLTWCVDHMRLNRLSV